ncbi:RNA polymerase sigma-70 factor (ECF subfamily) [Nakamurella sp. UYEF19]
MRDLDIAQESTADAFLLALQSWPTTGVPTSMEAWLITAARRRAVDRVRRAQVARRSLVRMAGGWSGVSAGADVIAEAAVVGDDELRMVVLCCDARLSQDDQVALTLRLACGVSTAAVAAGFGINTASMAARLTRAKARLVRGGPLLDLPDDATVDLRLPAVARVIHLAFILGHTCADGAELMDEDLADRAQYLAGVLHALRPGSPSLTALLALILLTRARAGGRFDDTGEQVLLADADRSRWDRALVRAGTSLLTMAVRAAEVATAGGATEDPMILQAAIAAECSTATSFAETDWGRVVDLYGRLLTLDPSPGFALGRCVALSHLSGPAVGLADLDGVLASGLLDRSPYAPAARAQMLERLGRSGEARGEWLSARDRAGTGAQRDYFAARISPPDQ